MLELTQEDGNIHVVEPQWAAPFFSLGVSLARSDHSLKRQVVAVLVPSRSFVAPIVALGAILATPPRTSPEAHLWKLGLPTGTECWYPVGRKFVKCSITAFRGPKDKPLKVNTLASVKGAPTGTAIYVPISMLCRLLPVTPEEDGVGNRMQAKGRAAVERLFGIEASFTYFGERRIETLLCGIANDLIEESKFIEVCIDGEHTSLLNLLRPQTFFGVRGGYRSDVVTSLQRPRARSDHQPSLVIFDGAYAYLNWGKIYKGIPTVVILDESSGSQARHFEAINRIQDLRERGTYMRDTLPQSMPQVEMLAVEF